jgi:hypothetical protein
MKTDTEDRTDPISQGNAARAMHEWGKQVEAMRKAQEEKDRALMKKLGLTFN